MSQWCSVTGRGIVAPWEFHGGALGDLDRVGGQSIETHPALRAEQLLGAALAPPPIFPSVDVVDRNPVDQGGASEAEGPREPDASADQAGPTQAAGAGRPTAQGTDRALPDIETILARWPGLLGGTPSADAPDEDQSDDGDDGMITIGGGGLLPWQTPSGGGDGGIMDLGNILGGVTQAANTFVAVRNAIDPPTLGDRTAAVLDSNPATTFLMPDGTAARQVGTAVSKKAGCRRRRRRLLTKSDLGDIAALKGIVGTGKNFENILSAAMYRAR